MPAQQPTVQPGQTLTPAYLKGTAKASAIETMHENQPQFTDPLILEAITKLPQKRCYSLPLGFLAP